MIGDGQNKNKTNAMTKWMQLMNMMTEVITVLAQNE